MVVTLPLVLLLLDFWPLGRLDLQGTGRRTASRPVVLVLEKTPLYALAALSGLVTINAQATVGALGSLASFPFEARAANALLSTVRYLGKAIWPSGLAVFYPFETHPLGEPRVLAAAAFLAVISAAAFLLRRRHPWLLTGWCWYLVTLLPVIGLIQVGGQAMADRYTYLPLVGIFVAGSWGLVEGTRVNAAARAGLVGGGAVALLLLAGLTRRQTAVWHDSETLFGHAVRVTRPNAKAIYSLGLARESAGDREGAMLLYREAIRLNPDNAKARYAYALALDEEGRGGAAIDELRAAVRSAPGDTVTRMALALLLSRAGRDEEAIANLRELIARSPNVAEGYNNLAALLSRRGRLDEAAALLRRALEIDPNYVDARRNLEALSGEPRKEEATASEPPGLPTSHRRLFGASSAR
jgi:tetratricopeptide (TPR) repeat protein